VRDAGKSGFPIKEGEIAPALREARRPVPIIKPIVRRAEARPIRHGVGSPGNFIRREICPDSIAAPVSVPVRTRR